MSSEIRLINARLPQEQAVKILNDNDFKLNGKIAEANFCNNEMEQIFVDLSLIRQWHRNVYLGNEIGTYTNWVHVKAESGYSIWKYPIVDFQDNSKNNLYFDNKILDNRGEATNETAQSFESVLDYDGSVYNDVTTEAASEFGTPFDILRDEINDILYIGSDSPFAGFDIEFQTLGLGLFLTFEYSKGSDTWDTVDNLIDNSENFSKSGQIKFDLPVDFDTDNINGITKYWLRIKTTSLPTISPSVYFIQPLTSVINILSLNSTEILNQQWAWCYFNNYIYVTIKNIGVEQGEGLIYITSLSSEPNKQNYFISEHEYKIDYEKASYMAEPFTASQDYKPVIVGAPTLNLTIRAGRSLFGSDFYEHTEQVIGLPASDTSYVYVSDLGILTYNISGFPARCNPICEAITNTTTITSLTDRRSFINSKTEALSLAGSTGSGMSRPSLSTNIISGEIRGIVVSDPTNNSGFLRLSAGGGTSTNNQSFIDISGFSLDSELYNTIIFGTSGTERIRINDIGNVGIFNNNPQSKLHIKTIGTDIVLTLETENIGNPIVNMKLLGKNGQANAGGKIILTDDIYDSAIIGQRDSTLTKSRLTFHTSSAAGILSEVMRITGDGKIGIGTTKPDGKLHIVDSIIPDLEIGPDDGINREGARLRYDIALKSLTIDTYDNDIVYWGDVLLSPYGGKVGIGLTLPQSSLHLYKNNSDSVLIKIGNITTGSSATDGISFGIDGSENMEIKHQENKDIIFYTNNDEKLRLKYDGKVGIRTDNPLADLHINRTGFGQIFLGDGSASGFDINYVNTGSTTLYFDSRYNDDEAFILFRMKTAATPLNVLSIKGNGRIGFGTTNPTSLFEINGNGSAPIITSQYGGIVPDSSNINVFLFKGKDNNSNIRTAAAFRIISGDVSSDAIPASIAFHTTLNNANQDIQRMIIKPNGRIAFGNIDPQNEIHLHANDSAATILQITNADTGSTGTDGITFGLDSLENLELRNQENTDSIFYTNNIERMRIKNDGKVGFGTASPNTTIDIQGGQTAKVTTVNSATYDLLVDDYILNVIYTTTGPVTSLTLPTAQTVSGRIIVITDGGGNSGTNNITIDTEGSEKINGQDEFVLNYDYESISLYCDGSNWFVY